jgi:hypothetical protein
MQLADTIERSSVCSYGLERYLQKSGQSGTYFPVITYFGSGLWKCGKYEFPIANVDIEMSLERFVSTQRHQACMLTTGKAE